MEKIEIDIGMMWRTLRPLNGEAKPYFHRFRTVEAFPISQLPKVGETFTIGDQKYRWTEGFFTNQEQEEEVRRDLPPGSAVEIAEGFYYFKNDRGYCGKIGRLNITPKRLPEGAVKPPEDWTKATHDLAVGTVAASQNQPIEGIINVTESFLKLLEKQREQKNLIDDTVKALEDKLQIKKEEA